MSFADFPLDVVLELTKELDLEDALHLAATCSLCAQVLQSPSFWISALTRMDRINRIPLPCVPGTKLAGLSLESLREMAAHAFKLHRRWSSPAPLPESCRTFHMSTALDVSDFHAIEGARMVVTVSLNRIACWGADSGKCLGFCESDYRLESEINPWRNSVSSPFVSSGMSYIGLASCSNTQVKFTIVRVDHRNPAAVTVSNLFSKAWIRPANPRLSCVMVNAHTIGAVIEENGGSLASSLVFCRLRDGLLHQCPFPMNTSTQVIISDGLAADEDFLVIGHSFLSSGPIFSLSTAPSGELLAHELVLPMAGTPDEPQASSIGACNVRQPTYGVLNVTKRRTRAGNDLSQSSGLVARLHFWPAEYRNSRLKLGSIVSFQHPVHTSFGSMVVGSSGTRVIIRGDQNKVELGLVHYISDPTPRVEFRPLPVPGEIQEFLGGARFHYALDDRLGILYAMSDNDGQTPRMAVVSYV
ncbi:hypothetical protein FB45DRAFT_1066306 [Roridomyces roridus]|uniref:F-box domain-containing protein n=1 Tax=Roridomyces roridus TaxID=1738132 RepID=A0AAD7B4S8_9AGAR|nr:hypothetical protein FB45DRAFT_1066306 [Roridomyces roridus]